MATKKAAVAETADLPQPGERVTIARRTPTDWSALLKQVAQDHWRRLVVEVQIRDRLMAGKPAKLDAAQAMIKARGLEDVLEAKRELVKEPEARAELAEEVKDEGRCEFHRRVDRSGIWLPTNNLKAGFKENWSVLGFRMEFTGSRSRIAEGLFIYSVPDDPSTPSVERDYVYLGEKPDGEETMVSHTQGPKGPVSSIKRHEYLVRPRFKFEIAMANHAMMAPERGGGTREKQVVPDDAIARVLIHMAEHGIGACRSQGHGKFDIISMVEVG